MENSKTKAIIYKPAKNAMQSGYAVKDFWELKFLQVAPLNLDPLMGWVGSDDTSKQVVLKFTTLNEAKEYADNNNISYRVIKEPKRSIRPKSYASNFDYKRKGLWTH
tara:strand:- start:63 stop:383 length:321 start_codon:yes stop_codon:yes gene_type:complete